MRTLTKVIFKSLQDAFAFNIAKIELKPDYATNLGQRIRAFA